MELEKQVCTLEQAKRLKELGVKQESLFRWVSGRMEYGYEGEWNIVETEEDNYFLFDHVVGKEITADDFQVDAGYSGSVDDENFEEVYDKWEKRRKKKQKACLSVAELGVMLPHPDNLSELGCFPHLTECDLSATDGHWYCLLEEPNEKYGGYNRKIISGNTEAEARAAMLIHLLENKILTAEVNSST